MSRELGHFGLIARPFKKHIDREKNPPPPPPRLDNANGVARSTARCSAWGGTRAAAGACGMALRARARRAGDPRSRGRRCCRCQTRGARLPDVPQRVHVETLLRSVPLLRREAEAHRVRQDRPRHPDRRGGSGAFARAGFVQRARHDGRTPFLDYLISYELTIYHQQGISTLSVPRVAILLVSRR